MSTGISRRKFLGLSLTAGATVAAGSLFAGCSSGGSSSSGSDSGSGSGGTQTITDDAGRELTLPANIERVYCAVPTSEAMVVSLAPEKLVGWVYQRDQEVLDYLPDYMADLPILGGWMGKQVTANMESIIAADPQVIIFCWTFTNKDDDISESVSTAEQIQSDSGVPCIVVDGSLEKIPEKYRWLGKIIGLEERGEELGSYAEEKLNAVKEAVSNVPDSQIPTLYYAEGEGGTKTDPAGSGHTQVIDYCRVDNIAVTEGLSGTMGQGYLDVSMENIVAWNPDIILVSGETPQNYELITTDPSWSQIKAVQDGKVYQTQVYPFPWFDRPPCAARILGVQWFANLIYPDYYDADIREDIKEYFKLFYNVEITDKDVDDLNPNNPVLP